jgi:uncharacterized protein
MSERLIFNCTWGKESPERATLPFVAANVAATAGLDATVVCTVDAVWLGTKGGADGVESKGLPALTALLEEFRQNGGKVWLCGACTKPRGITEDQLAPGVTIVGAATIVEAIAKGATPVAFA